MRENAPFFAHLHAYEKRQFLVVSETQN